MLEGKTKGYINHPQLLRFKESKSPVESIHQYLEIVWIESHNRGYMFDIHKFNPSKMIFKIPVTTGQLLYEYQHLLKKLQHRDKETYKLHSNVKELFCHPLFTIVSGKVEDWEII